MLNRSKRMGLAVTAASVVIAVIAVVNGRIPGVGPRVGLRLTCAVIGTPYPTRWWWKKCARWPPGIRWARSLSWMPWEARVLSVAEAAVTVLHEQLDAWEKRPPEGSSKSVARIAQELAQHVDRWPAGMQCAAADLALRILDWPADSRQVQRAPLIANCEYVLRTQQGSPTSIAPGGPRDERAEVENAAMPDTAREVRSPRSGIGTCRPPPAATCRSRKSSFLPCRRHRFRRSSHVEGKAANRRCRLLPGLAFPVWRLPAARNCPTGCADGSGTSTGFANMDSAGGRTRVGSGSRGHVGRVPQRPTRNVVRSGPHSESR